MVLTIWVLTTKNLDSNEDENDSSQKNFLLIFGESAYLKKSYYTVVQAIAVPFWEARGL